MRKITPCLILGLCCVTFYPRPAAALNFSAPKPKFGYRDASGKKQSLEIVDKYYPKKIVQPFGRPLLGIFAKSEVADSSGSEHVERINSSWQFVQLRGILCRWFSRSESPCGRAREISRPP